MSTLPDDGGEFQVGIQDLPDGRYRAYFQIVPWDTDPIGNENDLQLCESRKEAENWLKQEASKRGFQKLVWGARRPTRPA